jgi:hypothetical protein
MKRNERKQMKVLVTILVERNEGIIAPKRRPCNRMSKQTHRISRDKQKIEERKINEKIKRSKESQMGKSSSLVCCLFEILTALLICLPSLDVSNRDDLRAGSFRMNLFTFK